MILSHQISWGVLLAAVVSGAALGQQEPVSRPAGTAEASQGENHATLELMRQRTAAIEVRGNDGKPRTIGKEPLFRYNDLTRGIRDATLWSVGEGGRPSAIVVLEVYDEGYVSYEFTTTSERPRQVTAGDYVWRPKTANFQWQPIPDAGRPAEEAAVRNRQMKLLARSFDAREEYKGSFQLRLMPRPIYRYSHPEEGVLDGTVFMLAMGTNVEILLFIEAQRQGDDEARWSAGFARLSSAELEVKYGESAFWTSPFVSTTPTDPYANMQIKLTAAESAALGE